MRFLRVVVLLSFFPASLLLATSGTGKRKIAPGPLSPVAISARSSDQGLVFLHGGAFDPRTEELDFGPLGFQTGPVGDYWLLQFKPECLERRKAELEKEGSVQFFGYIPHHAFQVKVDPAVRVRLMADPCVLFIELQPGMKVNSRLWPNSKEAVAEWDVYVFPDESVEELASALERSVPGTYRTFLFQDPGAAKVRFAVPGSVRAAVLRWLTTRPGVVWVGPFDEPQFHNYNSLGPMQRNGPTGTPPENLVMFDHAIIGTGQIVGVADSGNDSDMCFFRTWNGTTAVTDATNTTPPALGPIFPDRKTYAYWVQPGASAYDEPNFHGTHTSGTAVGDDDANPSSPTDPGIEPLSTGGDGMAPNAQLLFQDIGAASGLVIANPYGTFLQARNGGARVHSNSYGSSTGGVYSGDDQTVDRFLFNFEEMSIFFSAGNQGAGGVGTPGNAKNAVTVGALGNGNSTTATGFSSRGPTADGRIKPDIQAPGAAIRSAAGNAMHGDGNCGRRNSDGTSMSCPTVAGASALLRQYFADGFYPSGERNASDGLNANAPLVKAVLLNGTRPLPDGGSFGNGDYGWGRAWLDNNLYFDGDDRNLRVWNVPNTDGLQTGGSRTHTVSVTAGEALRVTLVWSDPEAALGSGLNLVNNLDLTVSDGVTTYRGNVLDASGESIPGGSADVRNNVEQVRLSAPAAGTYAITVGAASVPGNGRQQTNRQGYALAVSRETCSTGVKEPPTALALASHPTMGVNLSWTSAPNSTVTQVYRARGNCATAAPGDFQYLASSSGASLTDPRAQGGVTYAYDLRGADTCGEGPISVCADITPTGRCDIAPTFEGLSSAAAEPLRCRVRLEWSAGQSQCPGGPGLWYNVHRSTQPSFLPTAANRIASVRATCYTDDAVASHTTYYYVVRAEDTTTQGFGPHGGNEESNRRTLSAIAVGPPGASGTWIDDGGDSVAQLSQQYPWQITTFDAQEGQRSYHSGPDFGSYPGGVCGRLTTPPLRLTAGMSSTVAYWARYEFEISQGRAYDGTIVEISTDGGTTWTDLPPSVGYPRLLDGEGNACQYPITQGAFTGPLGGGLTPWTRYMSDLSAYEGQTVRIRWSFASDTGVELRGFFLDTISITNVDLPDPCLPPGGLTFCRIEPQPIP